MNKLRIDYDDDGLGIIDKINVVLKKHGIEFVSDNAEHDGFELFDLQIRREKKIIVNAKVIFVYEDSFTYDEIVRLAYEGIRDTYGFTVVYRYYGGDSFSLTPGKTVGIDPEMIFNVAMTK
jgi:hypothetical protein